MRVQVDQQNASPISRNVLEDERSMIQCQSKEPEHGKPLRAWQNWEGGNFAAGYMELQISFLLFQLMGRAMITGPCEPMSYESEAGR